jgi:hypothetical protein
VLLEGEPHTPPQPWEPAGIAIEPSTPRVEIYIVCAEDHVHPLRAHADPRWTLDVPDDEGIHVVGRGRAGAPGKEHARGSDYEREQRCGTRRRSFREQ